MRKLAAATGNKGKLSEIREILRDEPVEVIPISELFDSIPEIEENGSTFLENALIKARYVFDHCGLWTLADDSGLEVDCLGGAPGVKSARYAGESCNTEANNRKLLSALSGVPLEKRQARFKCVMVVVTGKDRYIFSEGVCRGRIGLSPQGSAGFGYDPLFIPDGFDCTFAQLDSRVKNSISHRGKALADLKEKMHAVIK